MTNHRKKDKILPNKCSVGDCMRTILHIDLNSFYASCSALNDMELKNKAVVIGGNEKTRHGIVLAANYRAKALLSGNVYAGMSLADLRNNITKDMDIRIIPPDYELYSYYSKKVMDIIKVYSPRFEIFSIDECFLDYTGCESKFGPVEKVVLEIKNKVKRETNLTINIGVSYSKVLSKLAGEICKPDGIEFIMDKKDLKEKCWPLEVSELFGVGRKTKEKLKKLNILTIGDLANCDESLLKSTLGIHGNNIRRYARGEDFTSVHEDSFFTLDNFVKGVGNSITLPYDVNTVLKAKEVLLLLSEKVAYRLRNINAKGKCVQISLRYQDDLSFITRQMMMNEYQNSSILIWESACELLKRNWSNRNIRLIGLRVTTLIREERDNQLIISSFERKIKKEKIDKQVDLMTRKYGEYTLVKARLIKSSDKVKLFDHSIKLPMRGVL